MHWCRLLLLLSAYLDLHELPTLGVPSSQLPDVHNNLVQLLSNVAVAHNLCCAELNGSAPVGTHNQSACAPAAVGMTGCCCCCSGKAMAAACEGLDDECTALMRPRACTIARSSCEGASCLAGALY